MLIKIIKGFGVALIILLVICILAIVFSYSSFRNSNKERLIEPDKEVLINGRNADEQY